MKDKIKLEFHIVGYDSEQTVITTAEVGSLIKDHLNSCEQYIKDNSVKWFFYDPKENHGKAEISLNLDEAKVTEKNKIIYGFLQPQSYHTFLFPFLWNCGNKKITRHMFTKCLNANWKKEILPETLSTTQMNECYNQHHYFNLAARNAIYSNNGDEDIVWNYRFDLSDNDSKWMDSPKYADNKAIYVIKKGEENFLLHINGIRLKLFNTGIGIIIFELENFLYKDAAVINRINDLGRHVYMPYTDNGKCYDCADEVLIKYSDKEIVKDSLVGVPKKFDTTNIAAPILYLLKNDEYSITTDEKEIGGKKYYIEPIIDNRMFVACYYVNPQLVDAVRGWNNGQYAYMIEAEAKPLGKENDDAKIENPNNYNIASQLYETVFVDGNGLTCQSRIMLKKLLDEHIYDRWIEYGSIIGITEYSMVTITNNSTENLARNFLTMYIEMIILVLAQRASILAFEREISQIACGRTNQKIEDTQKKYVIFQSELLLQEVTSQQQGIELYNMLLEKLFVIHQQNSVEAQIKSLLELNTANNEKTENWILFILAILGLSETIKTIVEEWLGLTNPYILLSIVILVGAFIFICYRFRKNKWKK